MNLYRGTNSYGEALAIISNMTAGGFSPAITKDNAGPPDEKLCSIQKGTAGETQYSQESAWKYFIETNHAGAEDIVEYTTDFNIAFSFARPILIGISIDDSWCRIIDNDKLESGVMIYRRAPITKVYGALIKTLPTSPFEKESQDIIKYRAAFIHKAKSEQIEIQYK